MSAELVSSLLVQLGALAFVAGGFLLIVSGMFPGARGWAGRMLLLGLLFAVVAGLVTPEWLP